MTYNIKNDDKVYGSILNIEHFHVHDGKGIRTNVFFKGCNLRCQWCCNPESQAIGSQVAVHKNLCRQCFHCENICPEKSIFHKDEGLQLNEKLCTLCGYCIRKCPNNARQIYGKLMTVEEIVKEVEKDAAFYQKSGGGVTLSGGEPALQPRFAHEIIEECRKRYFNTAVETSGAVKWDSLWMTVENVDEILFDIKFTEPELFKTISDFPLESVKENIKKLVVKGKDITFRCPIITEYNDNNVHVKSIIKWAKEFDICKVDILPFHQLGRFKYHSLDMFYELEGIKPPSDDRVNEIVKMLLDEGLTVSVGG